MEEKDEVLATQKLLDTIRGRVDPNASEQGAEIASAVATPPTASPSQTGVILTRPLKSRSLFPGRVKVGLDIGNQKVKMVCLEKIGRGFRLLQLGIAEVTKDTENQESPLEAQLEATRALMRDVGPRDLVVTCLCDPGIIIREITLPYMPPNDLERAIPFEARKHIPYELSRVAIQHQLISGGKKDNVYQVLLAAVPHEALQRHQELLQRLGLEPYATEVGPLALANTYLLTAPNPMETIVLLDLGASGTLIDIRRDGGPFFCRHLPISGRRLTREIQAKLDVTFEEAERLKLGESIAEEPNSSGIQQAMQSVMDLLLMEVRRSLAYYDNVTGRMGFSRLLLTGGGALLPGLEGFLQEKLELPVEIMDPLKGVSWDDAHFAQGWIDQTRPVWTLAIGLASRP